MTKGIEMEKQENMWTRRMDSIRELETENAEMLEALEDVMQWIGPPPTDEGSFDSRREEAWSKAEAIIKKARGE